MECKSVMFYELCRLCLKKAGANNIFETEDLANDILTRVGVKILPSDNLPQKICVSCEGIIKNAKELSILAQKNDLHLRSLFDEGEGEDQLLRNWLNNSDPVKSSHDVTDINEPISSSKSKKYNSTSCGSSTTKKYLERRNAKNAVKQELVTVRKDLYNTTSTVTSSTSETSTSQKHVSIGKRIKFEPTDLECPMCLKIFDTRKKLYLHQRMHNKNIRCPLDACGKKFATKNDLEKHIRTHTGEKPYECDQCKKSFTQRVTLKTHKETVHSFFL